MFEYFYHEIFRRTIIGFGTLFNNILVKRVDSDGNTVSEIKVPLAYGPTQKFLARLEQVPDLNKPIQFSLPRMSFELVGIGYDTSRKLTQTQTFLTTSVANPTEPRKAYHAVPYNMNFDLSIMTLTNDDMLQIIEQILPYFQPSYTVTINLVSEINEKRDVPVVLENISMQDDYEGDFDKRRALIYTLRFTAKTNLFGPVQSAGVASEIIKKVSVGLVEGGVTSSPTRDLTYTVEPLASKAYSGTVATTLAANIGTDSTTITVADSSSISASTYITIDEETFKVVSKNSNVLTVQRGQYNTKITDHVSGVNVYNITSADNELIEFGDDFGFSGSVS